MDLKTQGMMGWKDIVRNDEVLKKQCLVYMISKRN